MANKKYSNKGYNANMQAEERAAESQNNKKTAIICAVAAVLILAAIVAVVIVTGQRSKDPVETTAQTDADSGNGNPDMSTVASEIDSMSLSDFEETDKTTEYVKLTVKDHGDIIIRLRADVAPLTVANFQSLVEQGFYDGLTFHRVYSGFMIQGGDPKGDGTGGTDSIKGEFSANGVTNNLSHIRGVISMARRSDSNDSGSCQFFICHADSKSLDGQYASFGYVVAGLDTVDSIAGVEVTYNAGGEKSSPVSPVVIEKACFVTKK